MAFLDTILVDSHDVRSLTYLSIVGYIDGLLAPLDRRGEDDPTPGRDGERGAALPLAKYLMHIPIRVRGATRGERNDNLRALGPLICGTTTRGLVTLTRRIATGSADAYDEASAPGRFVTGLSAKIMNPYTGDTELQYWQLKGFWRTGAGVVQLP